ITLFGDFNLVIISDIKPNWFSSNEDPAPPLSPIRPLKSGPKAENKELNTAGLLNAEAAAGAAAAATGTAAAIKIPHFKVNFYSIILMFYMVYSYRYV